MNLKLNWFCPVPPFPSPARGIAAAVLPTLANSATVTLWVHHASWSPDLEKHACVRSYDPVRMPWAEINAAEATVYELANEPELYGPIWRVAQQHPGIVILHDLALQQLFVGMVRQQLGLTASEYFDMMSFYHPQCGAEVGKAVLSGMRLPEEVSNQCPLTGAAIENAVGVAVHNDAARSLVQTLTTVPVACLTRVASANEPVDLALARESQGDTAQDYARNVLDLVFVTMAGSGAQAVTWMSGRAGCAVRPWFTPQTAAVLLLELARSISRLFDEHRANSG